MSGAALPPPRPNPFVGPRSLTRKDIIHGRRREISEIAGLLSAERIVLVYSPSGAGKSSLIEAGLRRRLNDPDRPLAQRFHVPDTIRVGIEPSEPEGNRYAAAVISGLEESRRAGRAEAAPAGEYPESPAPVTGTTLSSYLPQLADELDGRRLCLVFDQFEEVFTLNAADEGAKHEFFTDLGEALADQRIWALFAMREDFLGHLDEYRDLLPTRLSTTYRVDLLRADRAQDVVQQTAREQGVEFQDEAASQVVDDLRRIKVVQGGREVEVLGPTVEPLQLQVVCRRLWTRLPSTATSIAPANVRGLNVDGALGEYYDEAVAAAAGATSDGSAHVEEAEIRDWVDEQLTTEDGYRRQVRFGPGGSAGPAVLRQLENAYLIRKSVRQGVDWYELTHDRFVTPVRESNLDFRLRAEAKAAEERRLEEVKAAEERRQEEVKAAEERARTLKRRSLIGAAVLILIGATVAIILVVTRPEGSEVQASDVELPFEDRLALPSTVNAPVPQRYRFTLADGASLSAVLTIAQSDSSDSSDAAASLPSGSSDVTRGQLRLFAVEDTELGTEIRAAELCAAPSRTGTRDASTSSAGSATTPSESSCDEDSEVEADLGYTATRGDEVLVLEVSSLSGGEFELSLSEQVSGVEDEQPPINDSELTASIDRAGLVNRHLLDGVPGQKWLISVDPDPELDPVVVLLGPDGSEAGYRDTAGSGGPETLATEITEPGAYTVEVFGYGNSTGEYTLTALPFETTNLTVGGDPVMGSIDEAGSIQSYTVDVVSGDQLRVTVVPADGSQLAPDVIVYDPDGFEVAYGPFASPGAAASASLVALVDGIHRIDVGDFDANTGDFRLVVEPFETSPISVGETVAGTIDEPGAIQSYTFDATSDEQLRVTVTPTDDSRLAPDVVVYEPDQFALAFGSLSAPGAPSASNVEIPVTGTYRVDVGGFDNSTGDFTLTVGPFETAPLTVGGDPVAGAIDEPGTIQSYTFDATSDEQLRVTVMPAEGSQLAADVAVEDADGFQVGYATFLEPGDPVAASVITPIDGTYRIDVTAIDGSSGEFTIAIEPFETVPLTVGGDPVAGAIDEPGTIQSYAFDATSDEQLRITVTPTDDSELVSDVIVFDPDGRQVEFGDLPSPGAPSEVVFVVPFDGTHRVDVGGLGSTGDYTIAITAD